MEMSKNLKILKRAMLMSDWRRLSPATEAGRRQFALHNPLTGTTSTLHHYDEDDDGRDHDDDENDNDGDERSD